MKKGKMVKAQPMPNLNSEFSMEVLGNAIRSKRTERGWRIDDLALKADLSRRTVMKIEKGDSNVTFSNVILLMDMLGLSLRLINLSEKLNQPSSMTMPDSQSIKTEDGWYE
ncbi:helix-turn-helix domain-containing protein [Vibrio sp. JC009]|uniref:helix-turn-helix domain-containing protein n=1 Tax=Vibrio sp. JC009 TaxID=2912314 RepID=UPI0023B0E49B|nr:helix-turn-helix domain-containing protein [Vibrio sp. JC009]WED24004.1 helix-turn-helix domain-containing protein [Vibrio sp. JC009]